MSVGRWFSLWIYLKIVFGNGKKWLTINLHPRGQPCIDSNNQRMSLLYRYSFGAFSCITILSWFFESFDHFPIAEAIVSGFRGSVQRPWFCPSPNLKAQLASIECWVSVPTCPVIRVQYIYSAYSTLMHSTLIVQLTFHILQLSNTHRRLKLQPYI